MQADGDAVLRRSAERRRIARRLLDALPLVAMGLLAAASWWLYTRSSEPEARASRGPLVHEPDYTMQRFTLQRYDRNGRMKADLSGSLLRHYPDTDTYEADDVRMTAITPDAHTFDGSATRAVSNADGSNVQLVGNAHVQRLPAPGEDAVDFRSDFLDVFVDSERLRSHLPVRLTRGSTTIDAAGMDYDNLTRVAHLRGKVKATFASNAQLRRSAAVTPPKNPRSIEPTAPGDMPAKASKSPATSKASP